MKICATYLVPILKGTNIFESKNLDLIFATLLTCERKANLFLQTVLNKSLNPKIEITVF